MSALCQRDFALYPGSDAPYLAPLLARPAICGEVSEEAPSAVTQPVILQGSCFICGHTTADTATSTIGSKHS
ncbi:hypothetical protein JOB18_024912 [Solea senegalensis]|uniref:Uncharacterized protein n=1 Tax=Solea senegalensis TaxID=28829 RepID=A0AAV6SZL7_SOLSE|nr:hypothetical protein JOB18_024912 [Solea senegalensis]